MEEYWKSLPIKNQEQILNDIFRHEVLNADNLPTFMTERDWIDLTEGASVHYMRFHQKYCVILDIEIFAYRYWMEESSNFRTLTHFLRGLVNNLRVGDLPLFERYATQNMDMWFDFNMEAVYLWLLQHDDDTV